MPLHDKMNISHKHGQYCNGKNDLFAVVVALRYLLEDEEFKTFKKNLLRMLNGILKECPHISKENLFSKMGFPGNWDKIMRYKKN